MTCSLRPEALRVVEAGRATDSANRFQARHDGTTYLGAYAQHRLSAAEHALKCLELNPRPIEPGSGLTLQVARTDVVILRD